MVSSNGPGADESNGRDAYFIDAGRLIIDKDKASHRDAAESIQDWL